MSEVFDISQHISVEVLGARAGESTYDGLVVDGKLYNITDYVVTPDTPVITELYHQQDAGTAYALCRDNYQYPVRVYFNINMYLTQQPPTQGVRHELWALGPRDENTFLESDNPLTSGVLVGENNNIFEGTTNPSLVGPRTTFIDSNYFTADLKYYKIAAVRCPSSGPKTIVGTTISHIQKKAGYNYSMTASSFIGSSFNGSGPVWLVTGWTSNLKNLKPASSINVTVRDPNHPITSNNPVDWVDIEYELYVDDVLVQTENLNNINAFMTARVVPLNGNGTTSIKLYRTTDNPSVDQPREWMNVTRTPLTNFEYPMPYAPFLSKKMDDDTIRFRWDGNYENYYLDVYDSDGVTDNYKINRKTPSSTLQNEMGDIELYLNGLNLNNKSYLFMLYYENPSTLAKVLVGSQTYGVNPPAEPVEGSYDVTAYGWWPIQGSTTRCDITQGYNIDKGMLYKPEVGTCNLDLKGAEADPRVNTAIQLDNKIRVKLDAAAAPDGEDDYLFAGFIEDISTTYDTFGNAITQLGCVDAMSRVLNVIVPVYDIGVAESFSVRMNRLFEDYILPKTWGVSVDDTFWPAVDQYDGSVFPPELRDNVAISELINELTEGEAAVMVQNRGGVIFFYNRAVAALLIAAYADDLVASAHHIGFSTEHHDTSLDHFCISDFTISNSINDITNYVTATLTYDDATEITKTDQDSIDRYGERAYAVSLNLHAPAGNITQYLQSWVDEVPYFETQSELNSVTTNVVNRAGYVTRAYQKDATLQPIRVFIQAGAVDVNGVWFAKQVKHNITPESWVMELDLTSD